MTENSSQTAELLARAGQGDAVALREPVAQYRDRMKRMIRLRMSRRLQTRMDDSDILQEVWGSRCTPEAVWIPRDETPIFLWLRPTTGRKPAEYH